MEAYSASVVKPPISQEEMPDLSMSKNEKSRAQWSVDGDYLFVQILAQHSACSSKTGLTLMHSPIDTAIINEVARALINKVSIPDLAQELAIKYPNKKQDGRSTESINLLLELKRNIPSFSFQQLNSKHTNMCTRTVLPFYHIFENGRPFRSKTLFQKDCKRFVKVVIDFFTVAIAYGLNNVDPDMYVRKPGKGSKLLEQWLTAMLHTHKQKMCGFMYACGIKLATEYVKSKPAASHTFEEQRFLGLTTYPPKIVHMVLKEYLDQIIKQETHDNMSSISLTYGLSKPVVASQQAALEELPMEYSPLAVNKSHPSMPTAHQPQSPRPPMYQEQDPSQSVKCYSPKPMVQAVPHQHPSAAMPPHSGYSYAQSVHPQQAPMPEHIQMTGTHQQAMYEHNQDPNMYPSYMPKYSSQATRQHQLQYQQQQVPYGQEYSQPAPSSYGYVRPPPQSYYPPQSANANSYRYRTSAHAHGHHASRAAPQAYYQHPPFQHARPAYSSRYQPYPPPQRPAMQQYRYANKQMGGGSSSRQPYRYPTQHAPCPPSARPQQGMLQSQAMHPSEMPQVQSLPPREIQASAELCKADKLQSSSVHGTPAPVLTEPRLTHSENGNTSPELETLHQLIGSVTPPADVNSKAKSMQDKPHDPQNISHRSTPCAISSLLT